MEMYRSRQFILDNPFLPIYIDRYPEDENYFKPANWHKTADPHINLGNLIPDTMNCELPLENHRGAGHRQNSGWKTAGNFSFGFVAQYPPGRYSKAHYSHPGGPVLVCSSKDICFTFAQGTGYPPLGKWQWPSGSAPGLRRVRRGQRSARHRRLVTPFRRLQKKPFRVLAFLGGFPRDLVGAPGDQVGFNVSQKQGGNSIESRDEDPQIRKDYIEALKKKARSFLCLSWFIDERSKTIARLRSNKASGGREGVYDEYDRCSASGGAYRS